MNTFYSTNNKLINKAYLKEFTELCIFCFFLPPIISTTILFFKFLKNRNTLTGTLFFIFLTLFLSYNYFSVDNSLRFFSAEKISELTYWYNGDPLTYLISVGNKIGISSSCFFYTFTLIIYLFWFYTYQNIKSNNSKWDIIIIISAMILRNAIDLTYYTLAVSFLLFTLTKVSKLSIKICLCLAIAIYLLHPGVLIVFLPSIILYKLIQNKCTFYYYLYLVLLYILTANLELIIPTTGISFIDNMSNAYFHYTDSENKWGLRKENLSGVTFFFQYYVTSFLYLIIFIFTIIKREKLFNKFILSIFQSAMVMLPSFWKYVTITERLMVILSLTSVLCIIMLQKEYKIKSKYIAYLYFSIFLFHTFRASKMELGGVFYSNSYLPIQQRSYYIPSLLLFNFDTWGYSNDFIKSNSQFKYFLE